MSSSYLSISGSILPATVVQAEGLDATFLCQLPASNGAIEWQINGTSLRNERGERTEALIISALPQFNGTSVVCILYIIEANGTAIFTESKPALLFVQGSLLACTKLNKELLVDQYKPNVLLLRT